MKFSNAAIRFLFSSRPLLPVVLLCSRRFAFILFVAHTSHLFISIKLELNRQSRSVGRQHRFCYPFSTPPIVSSRLLCIFCCLKSHLYLHHVDDSYVKSSSLIQLHTVSISSQRERKKRARNIVTHSQRLQARENVKLSNSTLLFFPLKLSTHPAHLHLALFFRWNFLRIKFSVDLF